MKFISLFSGIGGIDLGLERAGMECAAQVEYDPFCQQVLKKHWPNVPMFGDIKEVDSAALPDADLICGGFPCQPVSVAGLQQAQEDSRWLWPEFARLLREVQPRYALLENVPGLLTVTGGRAAQEVFGDLAELGFDAEWACIPAAATGAPHLRYRVCVVAYSDSERRNRGTGVFGPTRGNEPENGSPLSDSSGKGLEGEGEGEGLSGFFRGWASEPDVGRVAYGVPNRVDRIKSLGNAVVPQVAEYVGRRIMDFDRA